MIVVGQAPGTPADPAGTLRAVAGPVKLAPAGDRLPTGWGRSSPAAA